MVETKVAGVVTSVNGRLVLVYDHIAATCYRVACYNLPGCKVGDIVTAVGTLDLRDGTLLRKARIICVVMPE